MPAVPGWDPNTALRAMDEAGIRAALLSVSSPGVHFGGGDATAARARTVNDEGADVVREHPERFGLMASLPLPDVPTAVAEAERALDDLGADGVVLMTHYDGDYLGAPRYEPLMEVLDDRAAVVCLHPTSPVCWETTAMDHPRPMLEFPFETARAVANLPLSGTLDRYRRISFIVPHAGAALPVLADRVAAFAFMQQSDAPVDVLGALGRLRFDLAGFAVPRVLPSLLNLTDDRHILYGSDFPFTPDWAVNALADQLMTSAALSDAQRNLIREENALRLFPRFGPTV